MKQPNRTQRVTTLSDAELAGVDGAGIGTIADWIAVAEAGYEAAKGFAKGFADGFAAAGGK
jgi:hypothetical protein